MKGVSCLNKIFRPMPFVLKVLGLIFLASIDSILFMIVWGGGTICALLKKYLHHRFSQWSGFSTQVWISPLRFSCACVWGPIGIPLIVVYQKYWIPLMLCCPANMFLCWIRCWLVHHETFFRHTYFLFLLCT